MCTLTYARCSSVDCWHVLFCSCSKRESTSPQCAETRRAPCGSASAPSSHPVPERVLYVREGFSATTAVHVVEVPWACVLTLQSAPSPPRGLRRRHCCCCDCCCPAAAPSSASPSELSTEVAEVRAASRGHATAVARRAGERRMPCGERSGVAHLLAESAPPTALGHRHCPCLHTSRRGRTGPAPVGGTEAIAGRGCVSASQSTRNRLLATAHSTRWRFFRAAKLLLL